MSLIFGPDIERIEPLILGRGGAGGKGKSDGQAQGPTSSFTKNMMHVSVTSAGGAGAGRSMSAAARDRRAVKALGRIARGSPEVMVRISGKQGTGQHSLANMAYISRIEREEEQHVELEDQDEKIIQSRDDMQVIAKEWEDHEQKGDDRRKGAVSRSYVLSMPEGTDAAKVKDAARAFAKQEFSTHKYVLALHTDTPRPHVHITVAVRDQNLRRHYPKRDELARYRETFARELRARGIEANATPCKARGVAPKAEHIAKEKMRGKGLVPKHDKQTAEKESQLNRLDKMLAKQKVQAMDIYKNAIQKLKTSQDPEHKDIAHSLSKFVAAMPARQSPPIADRSAEAKASPSPKPRSAPSQTPKEEIRPFEKGASPQAPEQREAGPLLSESRKADASPTKRRAGDKSSLAEPPKAPDSAKLDAPEKMPEYLMIDGKKHSIKGMDAESVKMIQDIQGDIRKRGEKRAVDKELQKIDRFIKDRADKRDNAKSATTEKAKQGPSGNKKASASPKQQSDKFREDVREMMRRIDKDRDKGGPRK